MLPLELHDTNMCIQHLGVTTERESAPRLIIDNAGLIGLRGAIVCE
jgi:hypothetical protein